jgi:hypothetical protein
VFRTLLLGVVVLGVASGWAAHWVAPMMFSMQADQEVVSGNAKVKCRQVRTVLDKKDSPPSCFEVFADDLATGRAQEQWESDRQDEEVNDSGLTEREERMMESIEQRFGRSDDE